MTLNASIVMLNVFNVIKNPPTVLNAKEYSPIILIQRKLMRPFCMSITTQKAPV
jgi:hypothetical protein